MGHSTCCVVSCKNTGANSTLKFYRFPTARHKLEQRRKWIAAVKRKNPDGTPWTPKPSDLICSEHFIGNAKSESQVSPSYVPSIFPSVYRTRKVDELAALSRHKRFMTRRYSTTLKIAQLVNGKPMNGDTDHRIATGERRHTCIDRECQVDFFSGSNQSEKTFICNRYSYNSNFSDVEIQTEIVHDNKQFKDKQCSTSERILIDRAVGSISKDEEYLNHLNFGISKIQTNEQLLDFAGVTLHNFKFLSKRLNLSKKNKISKDDHLLIFLIKIKTGLSFSAISILFSIHRTTISRIFFSILKQLSSVTADLVFWPDKCVVQKTMPDCFKSKYGNTRVIIDSAELKIKVPATINNRVYCYSQYKKCFTAKILIGVTPAGFVSFKSKMVGGSVNDSTMAIESGLIDLLEDDDVVLADKRFKEIRSTLDKSEKEVSIVMPLFLEKESVYIKEEIYETEENDNTAEIKIHVERTIQQLQTYYILNNMPENLFYFIDDIVHTCCVLVNLRSPIITDKREMENKIVLNEVNF